MPNGKVGDHPYTDMVVHRSDVFGPEIGDKVRTINAAATSTFQSHLATLIGEWPLKPGTWSTPLNPEGLSRVLDTFRACVETLGPRT